jgi:hypothetical protein
MRCTSVTCFCVPCPSRSFPLQWLDYCAENGYASVPAANGGPTPTSSGGSGGASAGLVAVVVILVLVVVGLAVGGVIAYRRAHSNMKTMLEDYRKMEASEADMGDIHLNKL